MPPLLKEALSTDIVYVDAIGLSAVIGPDWWGRIRAQPITVSVYLDLKPAYLNRAGVTDDVRDSIHYGHLCKSISSLVEKPDASFDGPHGLALEVAKAAFVLTGPVATRARIVVASSKLIPLAGVFELDMTIPHPSTDGGVHPESVQVSVKDLTLSTIIGVNPPEREAKQRVITNIAVHEKPYVTSSVNYPALVATVAKNIEASAYLTLEKFVYEIVRTVCLSSEAVEKVTVQAEKPSALSFARVAGVQITRARDAFVGDDQSRS